MIALVAALLAAGTPAELAAQKAWTAAQQNRDGAAAQLASALDEAGLGAAGEALLSKLAQKSAAARFELVQRAEQHALPFALLLQVPQAEESAPPALRLRLAKAHLERALVNAPLEEGGSFAPLDAKAEPVAETQLAPSEDLVRARLLAESLKDGALAGEAAELRGLVAIAANDDAAAQRAFAEAKTFPDLRDRARLELARLAYARGEDESALDLDAAVSFKAPEWLDALFEASWSRVRRSEDEAALGNLLTLQAPFFKEHIFPESFVLQAMILARNCRFPEARAALTKLENEIGPAEKALQATLDSIATPQAAFDLAASGTATTGPEAGRAKVTKLLQAKDLRDAVAAADQLARQLDSIDARPALAGTELGHALGREARAARLLLLRDTGLRTHARLAAARNELRELLAQGLRLVIEVGGREAKGDAPVNTPGGLQRPHPGDDEEIWAFQGEYWRDELGSYRVVLGRKCPEAPPQLATPKNVPAAQPASAAADTQAP